MSCNHIPKLAGVFVLLFCGGAVAQTATLQGYVSQATSGEPLHGASIAITSTADTTGTSTTHEGYFRIRLPAGIYSLTITYIGFVETVVSSIELQAGDVRDVDVVLQPSAVQLNPVTVSASRRAERVIESPAAIHVMQAREIRARPAVTLVEHLKGVPSVDVAMTGLASSRIVVRGMNNSFSGRLLTLTDYRIANMPGLRLNNAATIPASNADIERVEVLSGPGSALYGPNAAGGVLHYITKSPLDEQGTTVSLGGGQRAVRSSEVRHAAMLSDRMGYRISASYYEGDDWRYVDPAEPDSIPRIRQSPDGPILLGSERRNVRDFDVQRITGDARVDMKLGEEATAVLAAGFSRLDDLEITGIGYYQVDNWTTNYVQARLLYDDLFAQAFINKVDAGNTFNLRTGELVIDNGWQFVSQLQHERTLFGGRQHLTYGADLLLTRPNSDGTVYGRNEQDNHINETGYYLQSEIDLSPQFKLLTTGRLDHNNRLQDMVFSPRAALVYKPTDGQTVRLTYNKAFETTPAINLFLDLNAFPATDEVPYALRVIGVPTATGFRFRRDVDGGVDGLYMRSPFTAAEQGGRSAALPAYATEHWDTVVANLGGSLTQVPAPGPEDVRTELRELNLRTFAFEPVEPEAVLDIEPLGSLRTTTYEVGYKGILGNNLYLTGNLYYEQNANFAVFNVITANVFFDSTSMADYLRQTLPADEASELAGAIAGLSIGTISPEQEDPVDRIISSREFGKTSHVGLELGLAYYPTPRWTLTGDVSYLSDNVFRRKEGWADDISLNASDNKWSLSAAYAEDTVDGMLRWRYVGGFEVLDPIGAGKVDSYSVLDLTCGYRLSANPSMRLGLSVQNLLDERHREYITSARIGRLAMLRLTYEM